MKLLQKVRHHVFETQCVYMSVITCTNNQSMCTAVAVCLIGNPCSNYPCQNNGTCFTVSDNVSATYECQCDKEFFGPNCQYGQYTRNICLLLSQLVT